MSRDKVPFFYKFNLDLFFLGWYQNQIIIYRDNYCYLEIIEIIAIILKLGCHVVYILHEGGGHFIISYFTIISNNFYNLYSPPIKINNKWIKNESDEQIEYLLFGRVVESFKLKESLFLLNSNNHRIYNNYDNFGINFINSNNKTYQDLVQNFEVPFSDLIKSVDWNEIKDINDSPILISKKDN